MYLLLFGSLIIVSLLLFFAVLFICTRKSHPLARRMNFNVDSNMYTLVRPINGAMEDQFGLLDPFSSPASSAAASASHTYRYDDPHPYRSATSHQLSYTSAPPTASATTSANTQSSRLIDHTHGNSQTSYGTLNVY